MGREAAVSIREQLRKGRTAGPGDDEAPLSVSAKRIRAILTGKKLRPGQSVMTFRNLRITGRLDLSACEIRSVVVFRSCAFEEQIQLEKASGVEFKFLGCRLAHGIRAYQAQFSGDVELSDGCEVGGSLQFSYARVRGALRVVGCVFHGVPAGGEQILGYNLDVGGSLRVIDSTLTGSVRLNRAKVGGQLAFEDTKIIVSDESDERFALTAEGCRIGADALFDSMIVNRTVRLSDATFDSGVTFNGSKLSDEWRKGSAPKALDAPGVRFGGNLTFKDFKCFGEVNLSAVKVARSIRFDDVDLTSDRDSIVLRDTEIGQDLRFTEVESHGTIEMLGATIRGTLFISEAEIVAPGNEPETEVAISGDFIEVGSNLISPRNLHTRGGIRLCGAKVGRQFRLEEAAVKGQLSLTASSIGLEAFFSDSVVESPVGPAIDADRLQVGSDLTGADDLICRGGIQMLSAKIGGDLRLVETHLTAIPSEEEQWSLNIDSAVVGGTVQVGPGFEAECTVNLSKTDIGRDVLVLGARVARPAGSDRECKMVCESMSVGGNFQLGPQLSLSMGASLAGSEIIGSLQFLELDSGQSLEAISATVHRDIYFSKVKVDGGEGGSFMGDRLETKGTLVTTKQCEFVGQFRIAGAKVGTQLRLSGVFRGKSSEAPWVVNGDGCHVLSDLYFDGDADGAVRFIDARVGSQMSFRGARIRASPNDHSALCLSGIRADDFIPGFIEMTGRLDLTDAKVGTFWDAEGEEPLGVLPVELALGGFKYERFKSNLAVERRLDWVARSQRQRFIPNVYVQLSHVLREMGHSGDASRVSVAREKRAKREKPPVSRAWSNILWVTVGYGYKNWLAGIWLVGLILCGWVAFALAFDPAADFLALRTVHPDFNPLLYAVDVTVPFVDFNQQTYWSPTGGAAAVCLALTFGGYALATAALAAATGLLGRDDR